MRLLVVGADRMEFAGIVARGEAVLGTKPAVDWSQAVRLGGHEMLLVANGAGAKRAAAAVDAAVSFRAEAIASTGFCGALTDRLGIADIVVGDCILAGERRYAAQAVSSERKHVQAAIRSIDHVASTAAEKRRLADAGAEAVEMEAAGVAARAAELGLPFYCIRAVSDLAGEDMANDFNRALTADGHFDTMILLRSAASRPWVRIPELLRLRKRCVRAASALGDFFADCRF